MANHKDGSEKYCEYRQLQQNRLWVQRADPDKKSSLVLKTTSLDNWTNSYKVRKNNKMLKLFLKFLLQDPEEVAVL